jgi:hypothetical protein
MKAVLAQGVEELRYRGGLAIIFRVEANRRYRFIFLARASEGSVHAITYYENPIATPPQGINKFDVGENWTEYKGEFVAPGNAEIGIGIAFTSPGELWMDSFKIEQADE